MNKLDIKILWNMYVNSCKTILTNVNNNSFVVKHLSLLNTLLKVHGISTLVYIPYMLILYPILGSNITSVFGHLMVFLIVVPGLINFYRVYTYKVNYGTTIEVEKGDGRYILLILFIISDILVKIITMIDILI